MTDREIAQLADLIRATPIGPPRDAERDRSAVRARLAGPQQAGPGRAIAGQADAGHLPLFTAANEPRLF